jgi:hypothetical protein
MMSYKTFKDDGRELDLVFTKARYPWYSWLCTSFVRQFIDSFIFPVRDGKHRDRFFL